jgi:hypothetical protein
MRAPYNKLGIALAILGVFLFGGTLPATRLTIVAIDPLFLTAARAAIAGIAGITFCSSCAGRYRQLRSGEKSCSLDCAPLSGFRCSRPWRW